MEFTKHFQKETEQWATCSVAALDGNSHHSTPLTCNTACECALYFAVHCCELSEVTRLPWFAGGDAFYISQPEWKGEEEKGRERDHSDG